MTGYRAAYRENPKTDELIATGIQKAVWSGVSGGLGFFVLYFLLLTLANSSKHALEQFSAQWYWLILLALGFGVQLGLYVFIRTQTRRRSKGATAGLVANGSISAGSMIACCAHHLIDVLPLIGLSAAASFLTRYQIPLILLGLTSNLLGISNMLHTLQKAKLPHSPGILSSLLGVIDMRVLRNCLMAIGLIAITGAFSLTVVGKLNERPPTPISESTKPAKVSEKVLAPANNGRLSLSAKVNEENQLAVLVRPLDVETGRPVTFEIRMDTHSGSLDYDLSSPSVAILEDDRGKQYFPTSWSGGAGGHHLSGVLTFPPLGVGAKVIRLTLQGLYDVPQRTFEWTNPTP